MPTGRLYKDTHKLGYNTRDNPEDIPFEACQSMVNCFPGDPSPSPRFGTEKWNTNALSGAVKKQFPWVEEGDHKVILHIGDGLYWQRAGAAAINTINASIVPAGSKLSGIRIKDQFLINNNLTGANHRAWLLAWDGIGFTLRNANLVSPPLTISVAEIAGSNIEPGKIREYAVTLVNRNDADSVDGSGNPILSRLQDGTFHPGLLESIEDADFRYLFTNGAGFAAARITINKGVAVLDTQATHARIYVTLSADSEEVARGLDKRWLADIPIKGPNAYAHPYQYDDTVTDAVLAGSLDLLKTTGYEEIPPGTYLLAHNGRVWVGGVGTGEEIGRNFYSEVPLDVEFPQKWWTMFRTALYFKDTSYTDAERCMGIALSGNSLIFFMSVSLWRLQDGDPDFEARRISATKGTKFPNTITDRDGDVLYLSNEGPAMVVGGEVEAMQGHTAGEVWPKVHDTSTGYFFGLADKTAVEGFYFRETWWLTNGVKLIGMFLPSMSKAIGPLSIEFAHPAVGFGKPCVLDAEDLCVLASDTVAGYIWEFLKKGVHSDNGLNFMMKGLSKAMYVSQRDRDRCGEAWLIKLFAHFEDSAVLYIEIRCDFFRYRMELEYNQFTTESPLVSPDSQVSFRNIMEQPFPEGLMFNSVEIAWRKEHRTPYQFKNSGFIFEYLIRDGHAAEFISKSNGDGLVDEYPDSLFYATFDEDSDTLTDHSLFSRHHAYAGGTGGTRAHDGDLVPGGGQSLLAGAGSGYADADWTALDYIGDDGGFNSQPLTWEYVGEFPSLAALVVIHEGGDGESYWRLQVNPDGSLEFQILTEELAFSFQTAASTISAGETEYVIQFVLSNGGQNGQFYAAPRTGAFATNLTTRSAL